MLPYKLQIYIFSYLDVSDIQNVCMTSRSAHTCREMIVRDIWMERYPELVDTGYFNISIIEMYYIDIVWRYIDTFDVNSMLISLALEDVNICRDMDSKREAHREWKERIDRSDILIGRLERVYETLFTILRDRVEYPYEMDDEEEHDMFVYALMEYGHKMYRDIILSHNPYDTIITEEMYDERSNGIWFDEIKDDRVNARILAADTIYDTKYMVSEFIERNGDEYDDIICDMESEGYNTEEYENRHDELLGMVDDVIHNTPRHKVIGRLLLSNSFGDILDRMISSLEESTDDMTNGRLCELIEMLNK
jgi:hypothetical protein